MILLYWVGAFGRSQFGWVVEPWIIFAANPILVHMGMSKSEADAERELDTALNKNADQEEIIIPVWDQIQFVGGKPIEQK